LRIAYDVARVARIKRHSNISRAGRISIARSNVRQPFSFFNTIFIPTSGAEPAVLEHETAHIEKYHWVDLIMIEIASAIVWFNPIMFFYKRSLKIQHEYEADAAVLSNGADIELYLDCLLQHLKFNSSGRLISSFYTQNIKQRIIMMTKDTPRRKFQALYLLFLPVVCGLIFAFSTSRVRTNETVQSVKAVAGHDIVIVVDAGHGGNDAGSYDSEVSEKDLALSVARDIQRVGEERGVKVILTRAGDQGISLEERIAMARQYNASMFLSIHMNYDPKNGSNSGIDVIISDKNQQPAKSRRVAKQLKKQLSSLEGIRVNGVKKSDFYILSQNDIPAALLEVGYLSNKADYAYITDSANQRRVSKSIINAVLASFK
jgi:N-acetylmuramoyl-L-alanine amidase